MKRKVGESKIHVEVEFTDGYQERFTTAMLKIYERRLRQGKQLEKNEADKSA